MGELKPECEDFARWETTLVWGFWICQFFFFLSIFSNKPLLTVGIFLGMSILIFVCNVVMTARHVKWHVENKNK